MSKNKHDFITDFLFEVNGQFHQPDYDMLDSFYDLMQKEYEEKLRWIPVEEKLPDKQGHYLVIAPKSFPKNCKVVVAEFYDDNNTFYSESSDYPIEDATHWRHIDFL